MTARRLLPPRPITSRAGQSVARQVQAASQALTLVENALPDVLLLGLGLSPGRGLDMVRRVKACHSAPAVVAMTLFHTPEAAAQATRAGADALVGKEAFVAGLTDALARLFPA